MEANTQQPPLDMRQATDFLVEKAPDNSLVLLNGDSPIIRDQVYLSALADALQNSPLYEKNTYLRDYSLHSQLYYASEDPKQHNPLAVKIFSERPTDLFIGTYERLKNDIPEEELQAIISEGTDTFGLDTEFSKLSDHDKDFVATVWQHRLFEREFPEFVLPSAFLKYQTKRKVYGMSTGIKASAELGNLSHLANLYDFNVGRMINYPENSTIYNQVQNLIEIGKPSVIRTQMEPPKYIVNPDLSKPERVQVHRFFGQALNLNTRTGILVADTIGDNLVFNKEGRLILLDTNNIFPPHLSEDFFPQTERQKYTTILEELHHMSVN